MTINVDSLRGALDSHGQAHVLQFWNELAPSEQEILASQLEDIDFKQLASLVAGKDKVVDFAAMAQQAESPPHVRADGSGTNWSLEQAIERGSQALAAGQVGALIVAGGQGTRLGFDQPKGMFPIGPVSKRTLFEIFADQLKAVQKRFGVTIPWYVMVSPATDKTTREYFKKVNYFGIDPKDVNIFLQGTMPAVDAETGKLLLSSKHSLALSPDGHGGTPLATRNRGVLDDAEERGVRTLSYFQVDNPLADLCDPALIGHHLLAESEMTTQVIRKRYPLEKVGNVVSVDGAVQIIEYSDLPASAAEMTNDDGSLKLWAGNIAVHVMNVDFLRRMADSMDAMPFHRAHKKVPFVDSNGNNVKPESPNATKFERFIFDSLPHAKNAFVVECLPEQGFAPVKNADGAEKDTPSLAKQAISDLHRGWLEEAGVDVSPEATVEIHPSFALSAEDLKEKADLPQSITQSTYLA